jgi:hypothetical protein
MWWSCLGLHRTEVFVSHRNARLTVHGRRLLVERVCAGRPVAHVAAEMGVSRATAHKWVRRWRDEGEPGLAGWLGLRRLEWFHDRRRIEDLFFAETLAPGEAASARVPRAHPATA